MISAILFISFFIFLILGIPIGICLGLSSICAILYSGTSLTIVATNMYSGISKFLLLAIPFFVLSGNIMAKAGISKRLIRFVDTCVGHKKGGIAIVCVIVACFFGAISGSGPATVAALGMVLIPAMIERGGFSAPFATALMATSSSIAIVIPPSIAFVVYASITGVSIADMFTAGIVPGILMGVALVIVVLLEAKKHNIQPTQKKATAKERWDAFKDAFWGFLMPVIILGGIYGSVFTPTEAAAVSVVYGLFVGIFIYKEIKIKDLWDLMVDSAKTTGGIMLIVASASLFSFVCTKFGIAQAASDLLGSVAHNQFTFLLIVNIIFLIAGCFIDANSAMYIFIPIMLPVCKALGYDVVAFGIVATVNLAIGQVTPPVGVNLFVAISVKLKKGMEVTIQQISKAVMPMIAASVAVLLLITYVPQISTFLPKALAGKAGSYSGIVAAATNSDVSKDDSTVSTGGDNGNNEDYNDIADYSDLDWPEQTWNFTCSTTETSTWAEGGRKFGELMEKATGGKIKVNVYAADQLTNGNQSEGIQALMNGDPVQISMHSNLIYSAFDPRFNVVSLPFLFNSVEDADAKLDGEAGEKLKEILNEYNLHCMGIAENGFRQLTNSKQEVTSVNDMKNLKIRVAGSNLLMECYKRWGADATNMNWSETYTALQQKTVEGQENPLPAIDAASVQEVQPYCSMWNAIYDCLFFCINGDIYNSLTPEQQKVVDEAGQKAVDYERAINRAGDDEIMDRWQNENGVKITKYEDMDIDSFKQAVDGVDEWYQKELESQGYDDAKDLIETFTKKNTSSADASKYEVEDRSDLDWPEQTWNFTCSTTETSTWAEGGRKFGELMEKATGGKIKVNVYAADQLTNGNQSEGIQALIDGDPVQISMHSNLIYSAFDPRFNVVSLPFLFDSVEDADAKLDGEAGEKLKEILNEYGLHCMGIAENGFRQLTNSKQEVKSVDDIKNLKIRVAGSNLLMECYKRWGADATNMNWSETYTALQQKTVEGQENPLPAIDAVSVQEVQPYCSMWNAIYDCLFFCINGDIYDSMTPEQQEVIDECGRLATEYEREINRAGDDEIMDRWQNENGVTITNYDDMDIDSFKEAVDGVDEWYQNELESQGYEGAKDLIDTFTK
jgi:tripartite ATP-independent transporter DctM subunit/tripartite ATP-independent transporter DctP family solute receptor